MIDTYDFLVLLGFVFIAAAVYVLADWPGVVGLLGGLLITLGLAGAMRRARNK